MPTRRQALAGLLLAGALPGAGAQNVSRPWPGSQALPLLAATDLNGQPWDLAALRGRAVLINFWATWCAPCKEEMPALQTLAELEGERLAVLAVNVREPLPRVRRYVRSSGLTLTVLPDPKGTITDAWGIKVFPTTVLVDANGRPRHIIRGAVDWTGEPALSWIKTLGG
ncbi:MAG: TlpA family protein disulfide reductase [Burkholderiales bacterium]|nr:TlpA family protein disulfide reductase [Burkholderiales bacterium]